MQLKDQAVPVWTQMLGVLDGLLAKAEADPRGDGLLEERLAEDMHPLAVQVRFLVNMPGEAMARLTGLDFASREDNPATLAQAREWVSAARTQLVDWSSRNFAEAGDAIELKLPNGMTFDMRADEYVRDWALPQYYFHVTAAYAILRKAGLELGKIDYVPYMMRYMRQPTTA